MVSQYDKDDVEQVGLVKFDFWASPRSPFWKRRRPTCAIWGDGIRSRTCRWMTPSLFQIFTKGNTAAIFQFESKGMRDMLVRASRTGWKI